MSLSGDSQGARWLFVAALLVACKDKQPPQQQPPKITVTKAVIYYVSPACDQALANAPRAPATTRAELLINNCPVCGDWQPILEWNLVTTRREQLQARLEACDAFCTGDSKMKFMAGAENAAGTSNDTPWRKLADACGDKVSASADHRFMSAPYFALDRIARAAGSAPSADERKLAAIEIPLPALSVAGTGVILPDGGGSGSATPVDEPAAPELAITLLGDQILVGSLPFARLSRKGLDIDMGKEPYPGKAIKLADLPATLTTLTGGDKSKWVALLAPTSMPADKLAPIVAAAAPVASLHLGVASARSPTGWQLPTVLGTPLSIGDNGVHVTSDMPVQKLVAMLVANGTGTLKAQ